MIKTVPFSNFLVRPEGYGVRGSRGAGALQAEDTAWVESLGLEVAGGGGGREWDGVHPGNVGWHVREMWVILLTTGFQGGAVQKGGLG